MDRHSGRLIFNQANCGAGKQGCDDVYKGYRCQPEISRHWGFASPYFSNPGEISPKLPKDCRYTFAQVLSRHGARFPIRINQFLSRQAVRTIRRTSKHFPDKYQFLETYKFDLKRSAQTLFGQQQMINSGVKFYKRYRRLARKTDPFLRAAGSKRVVMSAYNFTQGFQKAKAKEKGGGTLSPHPVLIIPEKDGQNNTLCHGACDAYEAGPAYGLISRMKWAAKFTPAISKRINKETGAKLRAYEVVSLMDMCPFDTVAHPKGQVSDFCALFSIEEWKSYSHYYTLGKFHGYGPGDPLGPSQGVGWTNELISRLTGTAVEPKGSINHTLNSNPDTFPLDRKLYADFTHDDDMVTIYYAMGLYHEKKPKLGEKHIDDFEAPTGVPFAARMYVEKMICNADGSTHTPELVRVLINDRVVPLQNCDADELGRCTLDKFIDSLEFARTGGNWSSCVLSEA
ncbi:phosphoglycerate mutase-like protein [Myriangium duriaei CBS 260.36]|uniref:Phytase A n=1 Tax=Myriangium duriaei CBS 260.36 TaxID=1168546 RepID=A0A9P4MFX9_9PEZI|nr:phosphoglycerate mutase-like protein [Myriangium duriaei CBS 260.36]